MEVRLIRKLVLATEADTEWHPDAIAGRTLLDRRLMRLSPADREAVRNAIRKCYASGAEADLAKRPRSGK